MVIRDGDWTLFDADIRMGRYTWVRYNEDGSQTFRTDYECDPTVEANKAIRNMASPGWAGDYHHIASVPLGLWFNSDVGQAFTEGDMKHVSRWLNDSDNHAFRTKEGRV